MVAPAVAAARSDWTLRLPLMGTMFCTLFEQLFATVSRRYPIWLTEGDIDAGAATSQVGGNTVPVVDAQDIVEAEHCRGPQYDGVLV